MIKNKYCDLTKEQIDELPERFQGFCLSPFQYNYKDGFILVPEDCFKEMIDMIMELGIKEKSSSKTEVLSPGLADN